jgi:hypothetical protein
MKTANALELHQPSFAARQKAQKLQPSDDHECQNEREKDRRKIEAGGRAFP